MALQQSPLVVTNGLVFYYDMANTKKSFKGKPITNQFAVPTPDSSLNVAFSVQGTGTFSRVMSGNYGGYEITSTDVVYRYNLGTTGCHYHGNSAAIAAGQYVTFTVDYYISPDAASYPTITQLLVLENYGGSALGTSAGVPNNKKGEWQTLTLTAGPTSGSGTQAMFLYPGGCSSSYLASSGYILMKNPQCIFGPTSGETRPFVSGTRSTTQTLLNMVYPQALAINANAPAPGAPSTSMTYSNDNTSFSFDGTAYISGGDMSYMFPSLNLYTVELVFKSTAVENYRNIFDAVYGSVNYGPRLEQNSSGNLVWITGNNAGSYGSYTVKTSGLAANVYHHVAITSSGTSIRTYYNGDLVTSATNSYLQDNDKFYSVSFGRGFSSNQAERWFKGEIPLARIYNRALSDTEIKQNFNSIKGKYGL